LIIVFGKEKYYEVPYYAVFSILSLHLSSVPIFFSASCSQTPFLWSPMSEIKFCTHIEPQEKLQFCIF
jgi:hypothetical protein